MRTRTLLYVLLFVFLPLPNIMAQQVPYIFRHIGVANGLPDNYIKSVFQLPDGRLGVRTTVLLSLYDGGNFQNFPYDTRNNYYISYSHVIPEQYIDKGNRLWMKERGGLRVFDLTTEQYIPNIDSLLACFGVKEKIADMFIDSRQRYWFVTAGSYIYVYDPQQQKTLDLVCRNDEFIEYNGRLVSVESRGNHCWMIHENGIIRCYDMAAKRFIRQENFLEGKLKSEDHAVLKILENGDFWVMWDRGVGCYDVSSKKWWEMKDFPQDNFRMFTSMDVDNEGNAWVGTTAEGIYLIDRHHFGMLHLKEIPLLSGGVIRNDIHSVHFDKKTRGFWIGFFNQGICYYHPSMNKLPLFNATTVPGIWNDEDIRCMTETEEGNILMGTSRGLQCYHPTSGTMEILYPELNHQVCRVLYKDSRKRIWLGTFRDGLYCLEKGKIKRYLYSNNHQNDLDCSNIRAIIEDREGQLWVSVSGGLGRFNPETGEIMLLSDEFSQVKKYKVSNALALDEQGRLIVGSDNGLYIYDPKRNTLWIPERDEPDNNLFIHESNKYNCIIKDSRHILWFGTQYGLNIVNPRTKRIYTLGKGEGLSNTTIQSIQEDNNHDIWISTINSICKIEVSEQSGGHSFHVINFASESGWQCDDLYDFSSVKSRNGMLYFGRMNGFNAFTPENMVYCQSVSRPVFTGFRLFNTPILPKQEYNGRILFDKAINYAEKITLNYDENFVTFDFSGLNFSSPSQSFFRYQLEGFDREWMEIVSEGGQGRVTYNNLPPGNYTFRVFTAGNDKEWGPEARFILVVYPPFWATLTAWIIYFIIACLILYGFAVYVNKRNHRKLIRMQEEEALRQKEELDQMKFRFFTNISHELRTPLTLIITPLDMLKRKVADESVKKQLTTIFRNAQELLTLVNQLLDFRKLEMKGERLYLMKGDIGEFIASVFNSFIPMAVEKCFNFINQSDCKTFYMYFDRDKVHKIVNNLLSNAFKFTPDGGTILLHLSKELQEDRVYVRIEISDTGIGISETELPHIFDRFYQVQHPMDEKPGSGIGLHLIKEYVNIHKGKISVSSHVGEGSTFTIWLPVDLKLERETEDQLSSSSVSSPIEQEQPLTVEEGTVEALVENSNRKKLLIVEDNKEFRSFLKEQLEEYYKVIEVVDGEEGEKKAIEENPDLIVSDIMMPKVDGIELCRRIKTNVETSHIPVILLTARTTDDVKISSYEVGADSYMSKPFSFDMLLIRIQKLIEQQEKRKQHFRKNIEINPGKITITSLDEQLIQKALEYVEKNIDNTDYAVDDLSSDLGMTRMNLYRKLQSITGHTPSDFIRSIRLKRAAQLLQGSQLNMVEIADQVGFSSPSYFTKCFKEMFDMLPTQYAEKYRSEQGQS